MHLAVLVSRRYGRDASEELHILLFDLTDVLASVAHLALKQVLTLFEILFVKSNHLRQLDLFHLEIQGMVLFLDLDASFSFHGSCFGII